MTAILMYFNHFNRNEIARESRILGFTDLFSRIFKCTEKILMLKRPNLKHLNKINKEWLKITDIIYYETLDS